MPSFSSTRADATLRGSSRPQTVQPARDILARLDRVDRREVLRRRPPQPQALRLDQRITRAS
jgi:hypothetical protein